jgi:hypothetical protein
MNKEIISGMKRAKEAWSEKQCQYIEQSLSKNNSLPLCKKYY